VNRQSKITNEKSGMVFIALGSNLGDSKKVVLDAMEKLQTLSNQPILKSSLWQTSPVDCPPDSPKFINAVVGLFSKADETPESLLTKLRELEKEFGRAPKKIPNEPRSLDLDLIAFGQEVRRTPALTLPHPRAQLRKFVLEPLNEIAPSLVLSGQGKAVSRLLAELASDEKLEKLG
jgi:2-amino-4-hydroxy-6-hydroxymethyldihydropteridine diphosphokinase